MGVQTPYLSQSHPIFGNRLSFEMMEFLAPLDDSLLFVGATC